MGHNKARHEMTDSLTTLNNSELAHLQDLIKTAQDYAQRSISESTKTAYYTDFKDFIDWPVEKGLDFLPTKPEIVALYIAHLARDRGYKVSTLERRLVAISQVHKSEGYEDSPARSQVVRAVIKGIKRDSQTPKVTKKKSLSSAQIKTWIGGLKDTPLDVRDKAVILLGFWVLLGDLRLQVLTLIT